MEAVIVFLLFVNSALFGSLDAQTVAYYSTEAPLLLATPDNITVSAGTRLSLVCVAWGNPAPNITWTPDATAVPYQNVYNTSTTLNGLTYVVSILEVCYTEPQFSGTYSCTATNGVEDASLGGNSASFQVQAPPTLKVIGPTSAVPVGTTVALACVVESGYNSTVSWSRADGASLPPGASALGNLLLFTSVQVQTSGIYVCTFAGSAGPITEAFSLIVSNVPPLPTSSQSILPTVMPASGGAFPAQLVISASLGAGIPLFCIGLVSAASFILIFQYYFKVKRRNRVDNPLYNTLALPNALALDGTGATVEKITFKCDDVADYTSVL